MKCDVCLTLYLNMIQFTGCSSTALSCQHGLSVRLVRDIKPISRGLSNILEQLFPPLAPENITFSVMPRHLLLRVPPPPTSPCLRPMLRPQEAKGIAARRALQPPQTTKPRLTPSYAFTKKYTRQNRAGRRKSGPTLYPLFHLKCFP